MSQRIARGFTLVELVMVILLLGVMATFTSQFIGIGTQIYGDASRREQLMSDARFALERLNRELRDAVPGSVRIEDEAGNPLDQGACLRFWPIATASRYLGSAASAGLTIVVPDVLPERNKDLAIVYPLADPNITLEQGASMATVWPASPLLGHPCRGATADGGWLLRQGVAGAAYLFCPPTGALLRDECRPDPSQRRYRH